MTTQATQSNTALGRRSSPSSFFAPLQTLGLNMDRQKDERQKDERQGNERQGNERQGNERQGNERQGNDRQGNDRRGSGPRPVESRGGQDQLAQQSLAGRNGPGSDGRTDLQPEPAARTRGSRSAAETGQKDGLVFPAATQRGRMYPVQGRDPDPEQVRGAISRLAREYQVAEEEQPDAKLSPVAFVSGGAGQEELSNTPAAPPAAFAEVARRVWAQAQPHSVASQSAGPQATEPQATEPQQWAAQPWTPGEAGPGDEEADPSQTVRVSATEARPNLLLDSRFDSRTDAPSESRPNALRTSGQGFRQSRFQGRAEARALAHDAGNLLSALRLYGDLLCFSGVLHERHRHYAVDLKLLSLRSESLIERLLSLADQVALAGTAAAATPQPTIPSPVLSPVLVPAATTADGARPFAKEASRPAVEGRQMVNTQPGSADVTSADVASANVGSADVTSANVTSANVASANVASADEQVADTNEQVADTNEQVADAVEASSVADILTRLRGLLSTIAHGALEIDAGDQGPLAVAAPVEVVERILVNLVSNAASAIRNGGAIRIRAGMAAGNESDAEGYGTPVVVLTVDDSGCGISESQLRFALGQNADGDSGAQSEGETDRTPLRNSLWNAAAGAPDRRPSLGLLIVRDLVASTGGRLFIHSRQGTGTRMEIHWRAVQAESLAGGRAGDLWNGDVRDGNLRDRDLRDRDLRDRDLRDRDLRDGDIRGGNLGDRNSRTGDAGYRDWARARPAASSSSQPYARRPYFTEPARTQEETDRASAAASSRLRPDPRSGFKPYGETDRTGAAFTGENNVAFNHATKGAVA